MKKILYLELGMGAAGDMLMAALYELLGEEDKKAFLHKMNSAGIGGVSISAEKSVKCGICGTHMEVLIDGVSEEDEHMGHGHHDHDDQDHGHHDHDHHDHDHHDHDHHEHDHHGHNHHGSGMDAVSSVISSLDVSDKVRNDAESVYDLIAQAESRAHGVPVTNVHFHEVGAKDAIADVTGVCVLMEMLGVDKIVSSPVCTGFGKVRCAHGIMPVPAPATADLLTGIPVYAGSIEGELCTPTGAALVRYFADEFSGMPDFTVEKIGYGMGKRDFEAPNCVRAMIGTAGSADQHIVELSCNIDDMTAEEIGSAADVFLSEGAADVYTEAIGMKKSRPGTKLSVMCRPSEKDKFVRLMFRHTSTIGIRVQQFERYVLDRRSECADTSFGKASIKISEGYGVSKRKFEYEDINRIAKERGLSYAEASELLIRELDDK